MKIGFFSESYFPSVDGVSKFIQDFKNTLENKGYYVYIYTSTPGPEEERVRRITSLPFPFYSQYWLSYFWIDKFVKYASRDKLDLVHIHTPLFSGIGGVIYSRISKLPLIGTFHTNLRDMAPAIGNSPIVMAIAEVVNNYSIAVYNSCDLVTVPTKSVFDFLKSSGLRSKVEIVPHGLNLRRLINMPISFNVRKELGIEKDSKIVLYLGRITTDKGVYFLLNSFRNIAERMHNVFLVYAGTGPELSRLKQEVEKKRLQDRVKVLGFISEEFKASLLSQVDVQVLPSIGDTFGLTLAEGMAFGKIVIASNKGGMKDWIIDNETGLVFDFEKEGDLENKLEYALSHDLHHIGRKAKDWVMENLDIEKVSEKFERIYKSLVS